MLANRKRDKQITSRFKIFIIYFIKSRINLLPTFNQVGLSRNGEQKLRDTPWERLRNRVKSRKSRKVLAGLAGYNVFCMFAHNFIWWVASIPPAGIKSTSYVSVFSYK